MDGDWERSVVGSYLINMMPIAIGIMIGVALRSVVKSDALCFVLAATLSVPYRLLTHNLLTRYWRKQDGEKR